MKMVMAIEFSCFIPDVLHQTEESMILFL